MAKRNEKSIIPQELTEDKIFHILGESAVVFVE